MFDKTVSAHQLSFASLFRLFYITGIALWLLFGLFLGISALFGGNSITYGQDNVYGPPALFLGILYSLIAGAVVSLFTALYLSVFVKIIGRILPIRNLRNTHDATADVAKVFADDTVTPASK